MSINITNINNILKSISTTNTTKSTSTTNTTSTTYSDSIFEKASALVAEYKEKQNSSTATTSSTKSTYVGGLSFTQVANMSTKEFLNYAYENKATSNYKDSSEDSSEDTSGVKLPSLVLYRTKLVSTAGKSFMQVVAKLKAQLPNRSEEEIAAELMAKYGTDDTTTQTTTTTATTQSTGQSLNLSA